MTTDDTGSTVGWSGHEIAARAYADLEEGQYVNLGIGLPLLVLEVAERDDREVIFHSEQGVLGLRALTGGAVDPDLIDAGKNAAGLATGGSFFSHADSFAMIRRGRIDVAMLGAYEVAVNGDFANWSTDVDGERPSGVLPTSVPAVGGAVDLAAGARSVVLVMRNIARSGRLRLVERCTLPLTGRGCVDLVYCDLGIFRPTGDAFVAVELATGVTGEYVAALMAEAGVPLELADESS